MKSCLLHLFLQSIILQSNQQHKSCNILPVPERRVVDKHVIQICLITLRKHAVGSHFIIDQDHLSEVIAVRCHSFMFSQIQLFFSHYSLLLMLYWIDCLTLLASMTKTDTCANIVYPLFL